MGALWEGLATPLLEPGTAHGHVPPVPEPGSPRTWGLAWVCVSGPGAWPSVGLALGLGLALALDLGLGTTKR